MDGFETFKEIIRIHLGQKAVIASGFARDSQVEKTMQLGAGKFVKKPYTVVEISRAVCSPDIFQKSLLFELSLHNHKNIAAECRKNPRKNHSKCEKSKACFLNRIQAKRFLARLRLSNIGFLHQQ